MSYKEFIAWAVMIFAISVSVATCDLSRNVGYYYHTKAEILKKDKKQ